EAAEAVDRAHLFRVALGEVVVDGGDVDALAEQGVEVGGADGGEGLAFARRQFDQAAEVHDDAGGELDVERLEGGDPPDGDGGEAERLGDERVETRPAPGPA